jgi:hypothetical protein
MLARAHFFAPILWLAFAIAAPAAAAPEMFAASFIWHAWGNDISSGTAPTGRLRDNYFSAAPLGFDCQYPYSYTYYGAPSTRYCSPARVMHGHPATGKTSTPGGWGGKMAPSRPIGSGAPPRITMQQSDFTIALSWYTPMKTWGVGNCCRGFLATYPGSDTFSQSITYATFVNAAGSFFANGGAVAVGYSKNIGGTGTGRYNNRTGMAKNDRGTWRIRAGKNAFGGVMGLLGKYGATGRYDDYFYRWASGMSSWAMVPPLGRPFKGTVKSYGTMGTTYWWNPYSKKNKWSTPKGYSIRNAVGTGTLWTTGQVGAFYKTEYNRHTSQWRTGYDNRTAGGKSNW